jgi:hypothetical protein
MRPALNLSITYTKGRSVGGYHYLKRMGNSQIKRVAVEPHGSTPHSGRQNLRQAQLPTFLSLRMKEYRIGVGDVNPEVQIDRRGTNFREFRITAFGQF